MQIINKFFKYLKYLIFKIFEKLNIKIYTKKQKRILRNKIIKSDSNLDSIIFFTTHKCASNFTQVMLKEIETISEYSLYDYGSLLGSLNIELNLSSNFETHLNKNFNSLFQLKGEIYGPQRKPLDFEGLDKYKKIFFLRDPRDVLISAYYSFGFTHPKPIANPNIINDFKSQRKEISNMSLDEYVLKELNLWIKPMYRNYIQIKENSNNKSLFVSYSEYVFSSKEFFNKIFNFLNIEHPNLINKLILLSNPIQNKEDTKKHQRSGKVGQWREKLKPETINQLNTELRDILLYWEFEKNTLN